MASVTRLQLRSIRFLIPFMIAVLKIRTQANGAPGNLGIEVRKTHGLAFWTKTLWQSESALISFSTAGIHQTNKPNLQQWCNEAAHAHWPVAGARLPSWLEAEQALIKYGRLADLDHPSLAHQAGTVVIR